MTTDLKLIENNKLKNVATGEVIEMKSVWEHERAAVVFFRRWGCLLCRLWAKELSEIAPVLKANNVRLIGVSFEELGAQEFLQGKFFSGDLYVVEDKSTYNALGFKRFNLLSVLAALLWKESRAAISKARNMGLEGNMKGDGMQNGGALFVDAGGKVLRHFVQVGPAEHIPNREILELFSLGHLYVPKEGEGQTEKADAAAPAAAADCGCDKDANGMDGAKSDVVSAQPRTFPWEDERSAITARAQEGWIGQESKPNPRRSLCDRLVSLPEVEALKQIWRERHCRTLGLAAPTVQHV